jgi:hypothetical protein
VQDKARIACIGDEEVRAASKHEDGEAGRARRAKERGDIGLGGRLGVPSSGAANPKRDASRKGLRSTEQACRGELASGELGKIRLGLGEGLGVAFDVTRADEGDGGRARGEQKAKSRGKGVAIGNELEARVSGGRNVRRCAAGYGCLARRVDREEQDMVGEGERLAEGRGVLAGTGVAMGLKNHDKLADGNLAQETKEGGDFGWVVRVVRDNAESRLLEQAVLTATDARPGAKRDSAEMTGEMPSNGESKTGIGAIEGTLDR